MKKRLQVTLADKEMREIQRTAQQQQMSVAEWVRQTLRAARQQVSITDTKKKLSVIRCAAQHTFPTGNIDQILHEMGHGDQINLPE
jgi:hypothetical protein